MKFIQFSDITIHDGFWKKKQDMLKQSTVYSVYNRFCDTHRFDALSCSWKEGDPDMPHIFWDSDVAKWIEGVAYLLKQERNEKLEGIIDDAISKIEQNSDENGYFNSHFLVTEKNNRFSDRGNHELYCAGHLMEAACAYYDATGKDKFLKIMCKYADYIEKVFKIDRSAAFTTPGHPEIELALVRLYDVTGEKRYLELSKFFIDEHGLKENNLDKPYDSANELYNQDEVPLKERSTAEGHCVRALYLYCGMADIAEKYNDKELFNACKRVFYDMVNKKMYITGGVGSTHIGETFSAPYFLPNRTAYTETCAAIAMALFCKRMQALEVNSEYADIVEKVLYNGFLSGISMDGKSFFYENPLEIDIDFNNINPSTKEKERFPITQRKEVFNCSCCPPNIVRFIPKIPELTYNFDDDVIFVQQYINSVAECENLKITQTTNYPNDGIIKINCIAPQKYIALRIPSWCKTFSLNAKYELKNGYAFVELCENTQIELKLDMPIVCVKSNKRVHENAGRVAVMRGPVVYCAEAIDNFSDLKTALIDTTAPFELTDCDFMLPSIIAQAYKEKRSDSLYAAIGESDYEKTTLKLIPYFAFANRGEAEMLVWFLRK